MGFRAPAPACTACCTVDGTTFTDLQRARDRSGYTGRMEPYVHDAMLDMLHARDALDRAFDAVAADQWARYVPYGGLTVHDVLAHMAAADQVWALTAQGLLRGETAQSPPLGAGERAAARARAIERGRGRAPADLREEMASRRALLLALYGELEPRHLALALPSYGERHNSVRERIWRGYHDRLHADDVRRALSVTWHPQRLTFRREIEDAVEALDPGETLYVAYSVDATRWETPSPLPGWSYRQLLAHIATGDWVLQQHLARLIERGTPAEWPDIAAGNAERIEERQFSTDGKLIDEYLSMRHATVRLLAQMTERHLAQPIELWFEPDRREHTVLGYIRGFHRHEAAHREQLRPAMRYATARGGARDAAVQA